MPCETLPLREINNGRLCVRTEKEENGVWFLVAHGDVERLRLRTRKVFRSQTTSNLALGRRASPREALDNAYTLFKSVKVGLISIVVPVTECLD
jgi:hypothetical protein